MGQHLLICRCQTNRNETRREPARGVTNVVDTVIDWIKAAQGRLIIRHQQTLGTFPCVACEGAAIDARLILFVIDQEFPPGSLDSVGSFEQERGIGACDGNNTVRLLPFSIVSA